MLNWKSFLDRARLYCVLDAQVAGYDKLFDILVHSAQAGVDIFQIRDKHGSDDQVAVFARKAMDWLNGRALFIVNDRVDLALRVKADGVHIGQEDTSLSKTRSMLGQDLIIGVSCQTLSQAKEAQQGGADYIGFGSVFKTKTKPERSPMDLKVLAEVVAGISVPIFPIGGITVERCEQLKQCGVNRVAVTREICCAKDIMATTRVLKEKFL